MKTYRVLAILVVALSLMLVSPSYAWSQLQWGASWSWYAPEVYEGTDYANGSAYPGPYTVSSSATAIKNDANSNAAWAIGDVDTSGTVTVVNYDPNDPVILDVYPSGMGFRCHTVMIWKFSVRSVCKASRCSLMRSKKW
jgi:hypothetical protein